MLTQTFSGIEVLIGGPQKLLASERKASSGKPLKAQITKTS